METAVSWMVGLSISSQLIAVLASVVLAVSLVKLGRELRALNDDWLAEDLESRMEDEDTEETDDNN